MIYYRLQHRLCVPYPTRPVHSATPLSLPFGSPSRRPTGNDALCSNNPPSRDPPLPATHIPIRLSSLRRTWSQTDVWSHPRPSHDKRTESRVVGDLRHSSSRRGRPQLGGRARTPPRGRQFDELGDGKDERIDNTCAHSNDMLSTLLIITLI